MKLSSGSVTVNRDIESVFDYCCSMSSFIEAQESYGLEGYTLELDDEINNPVREGDDITIYCFAKYENDRDWALDLEILQISKNNFITYRIKRIAVYENENSEYKDVKPLPFSRVWNQLEFGIIFYGGDGNTRIEFINYIKPSSGITFKFIALLLHAFGYFKNRKLMDQWAQAVEKNA